MLNRNGLINESLHFVVTLLCWITLLLQIVFNTSVRQTWHQLQQSGVGTWSSLQAQFVSSSSAVAWELNLSTPKADTIDQSGLL